MTESWFNPKAKPLSKRRERDILDGKVTLPRPKVKCPVCKKFYNATGAYDVPSFIICGLDSWEITYIERPHNKCLTEGMYTSILYDKNNVWVRKEYY